MSLEISAHIELEQANQRYWHEFARVRISGVFNRAILAGSKRLDIEPIIPLRGFPNDLSYDIVYEYGLYILDNCDDSSKHNMCIASEKAEKLKKQQPDIYHYVDNKKWIKESHFSSTGNVGHTCSTKFKRPNGNARKLCTFERSISSNGKR